jgi:hypothetical protein
LDLAEKRAFGSSTTPGGVPMASAGTHMVPDPISSNEEEVKRLDREDLSEDAW